MPKARALFLSAPLFFAGCIASQAAPAPSATSPSSLSSPASPTLPKPPTPESVDAHHPGGDSDDPGAVALQRLLDLPWGYRRDYYNTLNVPLVDWKYWRRIKFFGYPTRASYRYGDDHHAIITIWYQQVTGRSDVDSCLSRFFDFAAPVARGFAVKLGPVKMSRTKQKIGDKTRSIALALVDGSYQLLGEEKYFGAIASYPSWPGTCLVQSFAVDAMAHPDLAAKVRDRWIEQGVANLRWKPRVKAAPPPLTR